MDYNYCSYSVCYIAMLLLAIANYSYDKFMQTYNDLNTKPINSKISTLDFINYVNQEKFSDSLEIVQISQLAGDAYSNKKLFLSTSSIRNSSLASFTVIAHELGHALQDKEGKTLKRLLFMRRLGRILGFLLAPSFIIGIVLLVLGLFLEEMLLTIGLILIGVGVGIFILALVLKLLTISIEKDASRRAIVLLEEFLRIMNCDKQKLLKDARMTYWADFLKIILGWTAMSKKGQLFN